MKLIFFWIPTSSPKGIQKIISVSDKTGEVLDEKRCNGKYADDEIRKVYFGIEKINEGQNFSTYLTITVSSKLLDFLYYDGITINNIGVIYLALKSYGIALYLIMLFG